MKFNSLLAFEKHIQTADPSHLSDLYLIVDPEEYVQKKLAKKLLLDGEEWQVFHADNLTVGKLDELLNGYSMFTQKACICLTSIEKLAKPVLKKVIACSKNISPHLRLVLTASSMLKDFSSFAKDGVVLDLCQEKPWDKEKRLSQMIMRKFQKNKLRASSAICDQMVKLCGMQVALIDQEVEKLSCYLFGKSEVTRKDLELVLASYEQSIFKIGQALFEKRFKEMLKIIYLQKFPLMMVVYTLRSMVQRCYRLKGIDAKDYNEKLPEIKGYLLEKTQKMSQPFSSQQLKSMLQILFEIELKMKSQPIAEELLMSLLLLKLGGVAK